MRITPLDVRKQEFRKAVRGFDCDEVRAFLTTLADEYETVLVDNKQIREQLMEQEDKIGEYKNMERTLRDTLMTAEKLMQESKGQAQKEGEIIVQGAHQKAKNILEECRIRTEELRREIVGLRKEKETYLARFKGLAEAQIAFIETHKNDFADLDRRLVAMVDSVVEGTLNSEAGAGIAAPGPAAGYAAPAASPAAETATAAPRTAAAPRKDEVDMWRDYNPGASGAEAPPAAQETPVPQADPFVGPVASPEAQTSEPEALVNEVIAEAAGGQTVDSSAVDMAAMGIPMPVVTRTAEEPAAGTDAITEAISATLSEENKPENQPQN
jgi:cell division initiation protein